MSRKLVSLAIAYDFDGTLAPGNMQEHDFIPGIGMKPSEFWKEVKEKAKKHEADEILIYMGLMLERANAHEVQVRRKDFENYGKGLSLFKGLESYTGPDGQSHEGWFTRINTYGKESGVRVEHHVISSGIREMVEGTKIAKYFKMIYASSFWYDHHGVAKWPALALNYTTKTQYLFRVNKGSLDVHDNSVINNFVPHAERAVPFKNMIFIGDGETDVPCFRLIKEQGGHSIAVYQPHKRGAKRRPEKLMKEGRINFMAPADYKNGSEVDRVVKAIIDKVAADQYLLSLGPQK